MSVHLPGRRRLRSPKLKLTSRKKGEAPKAEAPKVEAAPAPAPPADTEPEPEGDEGVSWSPDMGKDELVAVAQALGIYDSIEGSGANGNVLKDDLIKALEAATEN